ncbi:MAG: RDD family protein [Anaerorhabdus sp.]
MENIVFKRIMAAIIDVLIISIPLRIIFFIIILIFPPLGIFYAMVASILYFMMEMGLYLANLDTIGKMIMKIRVVDANRKKVTIEMMALRTLIKSFSIFFILGIISWISVVMIMFNYHALHDLASRTIVCHKN